MSKARTLDDVLGPIAALKTTRAKGDAFERLTKWFLENDPVLGKRFEKVEMWKKWKHNDGQDTGIDLVATEKDGTWCAIQCKYHEDRTQTVHQSEVKGLVAKAESLSKKHKSQTRLEDHSLAARVEALSKKHKREMHLMFVHSGGDLSSNATKMLRDANCSVIGYHDLRSSHIQDWSLDRRAARAERQDLREHQKEALSSVVGGFKGADRGQLIMACGTGKTRTAMTIAEKMVGGGGWALYIVPSISLIHQTLDEWSRHANISHHYVVVCSDDTIEIDDGSVLDLPYPATTDPGQIRSRMAARADGDMGVVFCTYQSVPRLEGIKFDLMVCDEAHRTTGAKDDSPFRLVHDNGRIPAKKRLYMTATPRVYKGGDEEENAKFSMDDEEDYGKRFFHYSFARAVADGNLANVGIRVPVVPEEDLERFMDESEEGYSEGTIDERVLLAAVWHGLNYGADEEGNEERRELLQSVIAFTNSIKASKSFTGAYTGSDKTPDESASTAEKMAREAGKSSTDRSFAKSVADYEGRYREPTNNTVTVRHVDGTMKSSIRNRKLDWLRDSGDDRGQCRILSNARCLSEGVDVPALDGVIFLQPRKSRVDVIQAVGRVMRKAGKKEMGYIIVPIVKPKGMSLAESFRDRKNKPWRPLWDIINAIRSHDETMEAKLSRIQLGPGGSGPGSIEGFNAEIIWMGSFNKQPLSELFGELKTAMVDKIVNLQYYDTKAEELGRTAREIAEIIKRSKNPNMKSVLDGLTDGLRQVINESVDRQQAMAVLAQHLVLSRIFEALFPKEFRARNPVSAVLDDATGRIGFKRELEPYNDYFDKVTREVQSLQNDQKQAYIKKIYGSFLAGYDKKKQESEGIVYTPVEVVDFIIHSTESLVRRHFNTGFNCQNVKILDPFTGTGTFVARLLESGLIKPSKIRTKYQNDIWANEITLLAYYVAAVNIEMVFRQVVNMDSLLPFDHANFTDTLNHHPRYRVDVEARKEQKKLSGVFERVNKQIQDLKWAHVHVIMGNPPYSAGQKSFDDNNANTKYSDIDDRIKATYLKGDTKRNVNSIYDSYIRSIRWMSDRITDRGIIGIVTNGSFMRSDAASGMRASLVEEFDEIWCLDLSGNARTKGKERRKEGGNVFGLGSRAPVAITFLVKNPQKDKKESGKIYYKYIGDYLDASEKIAKLVDWESIQGIDDWTIIIPDRHNDWINKRNDRFYDYMPIGNKDTKSKASNITIFNQYSNGIKTQRDIWAYNSSKITLGENMKKHVDYYNSANLKNFVSDTTKGKWDRELKNRRLKNQKQEYDSKKICLAAYRPFFNQYLYFDSAFNAVRYRIPYFFPKGNENNYVICITGKSNLNFGVIMTNLIPDLHYNGDTQCFPLYTYDKNICKENISDSVLHEYRKQYKNIKISKSDIFYYVYGLLHHQGYRTKFMNTLTKELPHISMAPDFLIFRDIGKKLACIHLTFDTCERYDLGKPRFIPKKFSKISFGKKMVRKGNKTKKQDDYSIIRVDGQVLFENIPDTAYTVNGRTPLAWIVDRYKVTIDKESGIINDPCTGTDIIAVIERAVYVGLESERLIAQLPKEFEPKEWKPRRRGLDGYVDTKSYDTTLD
ncbi:MAG: DEAD/DEAH box helicase family protein [Nitrosopumilus sp.]|nr:DEAD/DEAH box helicase family protein [Nitrosopumilus sp.]